jgi:hypothetical protein
MQYVWIFANQIAGSADFPIAQSAWPQGFTLVEVEPDVDLNQVYWNGSALVAKPNAPSSDHVWDGARREWIVPTWP